MITFVKKYWFLVLLASLATLLVVVNSLVTRPSKTQPPTVQAPSWKGVVPGQTNESELASALGQPEDVQQQADGSVFSFPREGGGPSNEVVVQNGVVGLVKEKIPGANISTFRQKYGEPAGEYWGPQKEAGFKTYVYPTRGLAVVAGTGDGAVFEVWYFQPVTLEQFLATWGKDFTLEYTRPESF